MWSISLRCVARICLCCDVFVSPFDKLLTLKEYIGSDAPLRHKLTVHVIPDIQNQTQPNSDAGTIECDGAEEETNSIVLPEVCIKDSGHIRHMLDCMCLSNCSPKELWIFQNSRANYLSIQV